MTTSDPGARADQRRRFGLMLLGIAVALASLFVTLSLLIHQYWMLAFIVLIVPNVYMGVRELLASRRSQ